MKSVLVVDDEEAIRGVIAERLKREGFSCKASSDGFEALQIISNNKFDLVITDINMPGMDGVELIKSLKEMYSDLDIVAITGHSQDYTYSDIVGAGAADFIIKPFDFSELFAKLKRIKRERDLLRELAKSEEKFKILSLIDELTGLGNRRSLFDQLNQKIAESLRYGKSLSVLWIDIDHFKKVNDIYGHMEGDIVLRRIGELLPKLIRAADSAYLYGGDEFIVLMPQTNIEKALLTAERVRKGFDDFVIQTKDERIIKITVSIGATGFLKEEEESADAFLNRADKALYRSKEKRNYISKL